MEKTQVATTVNCEVWQPSDTHMPEKTSALVIYERLNYIVDSCYCICHILNCSKKFKTMHTFGLFM